MQTTAAGCGSKPLHGAETVAWDANDVTGDANNCMGLKRWHGVEMAPGGMQTTSAVETTPVGYQTTTLGGKHCSGVSKHCTAP